MKKIKILCLFAVAALLFTACAKDLSNGLTSELTELVAKNQGPPVPPFTAEDKNGPVTTLDPVRSGRTNSSGNGVIKITSGEGTNKFTGIRVLFGNNVTDRGYLKVAAYVFDLYESFDITVQHSSEYWDYTIVDPKGEGLVGEGANAAYVFILSSVRDKNTQQLFLTGWVEKEIEVTPMIVNLGFIGYYEHSGTVMSTSIHWQNLEEGDMVDWDAVDAAYATWIAQGGLAPDRTLWQTSGFASFTFADYATLGFGDFNIGQLEGFYKAYFVCPGYVLPQDGDGELNNTKTIEVDEHMSGGQYGYVGMSYTGNTAPTQFVQLLGNDYTYEIVERIAWPGLNNEDGVQLPVIGSMNPVFNVLGNPNVPGQQTMARAGTYTVKATHKVTGDVSFIVIIINPTVQDAEKLNQ